MSNRARERKVSSASTWRLVALGACACASPQARDLPHPATAPAVSASTPLAETPIDTVSESRTSAVAEPTSTDAGAPADLQRKVTVRIGDQRKNACASNLVAGTTKILASPEFHAKLAALGKLRAQPKDKDDLGADSLLAAFEGRSAERGASGPLPGLVVFRPAEACPGASFKARRGDLPAVTDVFVCQGKAAIQIDEAILNRWYSGGAGAASISKACAINTLAHELTHTIVADPAHDNSRQLYTDDGYRSLTGPVRLVSYTLGSLAQCTYMQKNTLIPPTDAAFDECMRTWGTHSFMVSKECTKHDKTPVAETDCPLP